MSNVPDPKIKRPTDVIVKVTTNICGSDLHVYEGRADFEKGRIFGHENLGEVIGLGNGVDGIKARRTTPPCTNCSTMNEALEGYVDLLAKRIVQRA